MHVSEANKKMLCPYKTKSKSADVFTVKSMGWLDAMRRLNRRKLIEEFEVARSGFAQACMKVAEYNDEVMLFTMAAHHTGVNKIIVDLGGEDVLLPDYSKFFTSNASAQPRGGTGEKVGKI